MSDPLQDFLRREEAKRGGNWDPAERWQAIQDFLSRAAQEAGRNTPQACLRKERRILKDMGKLPADE